MSSRFAVALEANTAEELKEQVAALYTSFFGAQLPAEARANVSPPTVSEPEASADCLAPASDHGKKTGKKAKTEKKPEATAVDTVVAQAAPPAPAKKEHPQAPATPPDDDIFGDEKPAPPPAPVPYTIADCQKRLQAVVAKHGVMSAKEILTKFGCAKLVDLKEENFSAFIGACDEAAAK